LPKNSIIGKERGGATRGMKNEPHGKRKADKTTVKPEITHTVITHTILNPPLLIKHMKINLRKPITCDNP
jgi:hypothetical protein